MPSVWPFIPIPNSHEELGWLTDVLLTRLSEQRLSLRGSPRQTINYDFALSDAELVKAEDIIRNGVGADFLVPVWFESTSGISVLASDTVLAVDTDADYRVGGNVIIWGGCENYVVGVVALVGVGNITLVSPVGVTLPKASVMPLRKCFIRGGLQGQRLSGRGRNRVRVVFESRENVDLSASTYPQYLGIDLIEKCGVVKPLSLSVMPSLAFIDNQLGQISLETTRDVLSGRYVMSWVMRGDTLWARRKWLHSVRGMAAAFWLADWQNDLVVIGTILSTDTSILVSPAFVDLADYVGHHIFVKHISSKAVEITAAVEDSGNHRLTIAPLGFTATEAKISFLRKVRISSDQIRFNHAHGFVSHADIPLIEVHE